MNAFFDLKKSKIWQNLQVVSLVRNKLFLILIIFVYILGFSSFIVLFLKSLDILVLEKLESFIFKLILLFFLVLLSFHFYYVSEIRRPKIKERLSLIKNLVDQGKRINLADYISIPCALAIKRALDKNELKNDFEISTDVLLSFLLKEKRIQFIMSRIGITSKEFIDGLGEYLRNKNQANIQKLDELFIKALSIAVKEGYKKINLGILLAVLSVLDPYFAKVIFDLDMKLNDILNVIYWEAIFYKQKNKRFNLKYPKRTGGIGRNWSFGYALGLSGFATDMTEILARRGLPLSFFVHRKKTEEMEKILARASHHNVILVGEPGVGKRTVILDFAKRIYEGRTFKLLAGRRLMELNLDILLAGANTPGEIVERLNTVFSETVRAGNIILFIDNLHSILGSGIAKVGSIDASDVILPYLENPELYFITTSDTSSFHRYIEPKRGIFGKFEKIDIQEPTASQTIRILEDQLPQIEGYSRMMVSYGALKSIVDLCDRLIYDKYFPEKAIDLLNEVVVYAASLGSETIVLPSHVEKVISQKTKVPVGEILGEEKEKLLHLEEILHQRVVDQEEAIKQISDAMRRARAGIEVSKKPIGTFLFLGPTGVGKTETCKALAEAYFGNEEAMIRFDMSEYQDVAGIYRFIGLPPGTPGAESGGELTRKVKDNPFSLILLDEVEKAHPDILNLFLQVFDEGWITDSLGRKVKFSNNIIIATSNAGAEYIRQCLKEKVKYQDIRAGLLDYLQTQMIFRPEFLNRFTTRVAFNPLTPSHVEEITNLLVKKLVGHLGKEKEVTLKIMPKAIKKLAEIGYDPELGARPIKRVIQEKIENILAKKMLSGEIKRGDTLIIDVQDIV